MDGSGAAADVYFDVAAPPGTRVLVELARGWRGRTVLARTAAVAADDSGIAHVVWTGGREGDDRTLLATSCIEGKACGGTTEAIVHVRRLAIGPGTASALPPGARLPLVLRSPEARLVATIHRDPWTPGDPALAPAVRLDPARPALTVPALAPGLYRLVIEDADGNVRALPLPIRGARALDAPKRGTVLVVLPYLTWRGYNEWDDDDDGRPDTWYANGAGDGQRPWQVSLLGPLENPRVPQGAERDLRNTAPLMPWLREQPRRLQVATDVDVAGMTPEALARYAGLLFPGHSEYVPPRLFWLVRRYRDGGGRIAMLSANGFYRHVTVAPDGRVVADPRPLRRRARSDRSLLGSAYITCCFAARPGYAVQRGARAAVPWLFRGTALRRGALIGAAAVEVDGVGLYTPRTTVIVAAAPVTLQSGRRGRSTITFLPSRRGTGGVLNFGNVGFLRSTVDPALAAPRRLAARALLENAWAWLAAGPGARVVR